MRCRRPSFTGRSGGVPSERAARLQPEACARGSVHQLLRGAPPLLKQRSLRPLPPSRQLLGRLGAPAGRAVGGQRRGRRLLPRTGDERRNLRWVGGWAGGTMRPGWSSAHGWCRLKPPQRRRRSQQRRAPSPHALLPPVSLPLAASTDMLRWVFPDHPTVQCALREHGRLVAQCGKLGLRRLADELQVGGRAGGAVCCRAASGVACGAGRGRGVAGRAQQVQANTTSYADNRRLTFASCRVGCLLPCSGCPADTPPAAAGHGAGGAQRAGRVSFGSLGGQPRRVPGSHGCAATLGAGIGCIPESRTCVHLCCRRRIARL